MNGEEECKILVYQSKCKKKISGNLGSVKKF